MITPGRSSVAKSNPSVAPVAEREKNRVLHHPHCSWNICTYVHTYISLSYIPPSSIVPLSTSYTTCVYVATLWSAYLELFCFISWLFHTPQLHSVQSFVCLCATLNRCVCAINSLYSRSWLCFHSQVPFCSQFCENWLVQSKPIPLFLHKIILVWIVHT